MARLANFSNLSHEDLLLALQELVRKKRVSPLEIRSTAERARRIAALETELKKLRSGEAAPARGPGRPVGSGSKPKRHITNSPALKAARIWQGKYLGRLRKLSAKDKARVKAVAKSEGVPAAVKLADRILG